VRKATATGTALLVVLATLLLGLSPASATTAPSPADTPAPTATDGSGGTPPAGEVIRARVRTEDGENVAGVRITVERDAKQVAEGVTDDRGTAEITVPEPGPYTVVLDTESVPEAFADLEPRQDSIDTTVSEGNPRTVAFRLGEGGAVAAGGGFGLDRLPQLVVNGLRFGLIVALASIGLSLIFGTTGLTNFAHGELVTFGALVAYFFNVVTGLQLIPATILTVLVCAGFGWLNDRGLWAPLRRRGTGLIAMMIVSIGLAIFLRYLFLYVFGGTSKFFADYQAQAGVGFGPVALRPADWISMAVATVVIIGVGLALLRTRLGKATRAVADNPALAAASGIDVDRVIRTVWIGGAALAGLAGVLLGLAQAVNFQMGFQILLLVFAAVTLGGLGTAFGALVGSLIVGVFIEVSTLVIPTELKNVGALAVLIVILLIRPQGILGRAERIG
jgi:neutral amino acid transport system permease protein